MVFCTRGLIYSITKRHQLVHRCGQASRSASGLRHQWLWNCTTTRFTRLSIWGKTMHALIYHIAWFYFWCYRTNYYSATTLISTPFVGGRTLIAEMWSHFPWWNSNILSRRIIYHCPLLCAWETLGVSPWLPIYILYGRIWIKCMHYHLVI